MATVNKDFKIKSGLIVEGTTGTINGQSILTEASTQFIIDTVGGSATSNNTPDSVVLRDANGDFAAGTITADIVGDVTGQVSDISNHSTSDLTEGTNLYYTDARAVAAQSGLWDAAGSATNAYNDAVATAGTYTDGKISDEVTNRNNAISNAVSSTETYADNAANNAYSNAVADAATDATTKANAAETAAKAYADGIAGNYDAAGSAAAAEANANLYTDGKVAGLVDSAPELLNTLNEIAAAIADNPNYATDVANLVSTKADTTYVDSQDAATLASAETYTDGQITTALSTAQGYADAAELSAAGYTDSAISSEVTNRDAAIATAKAAAIADAGTYADGLIVTEVSDRNTAISNAVNALSTTDIEEGSNLYFTDARAQSAVAADISSAVNALSTSDIEEGTNLYFTDQRAQDAVAIGISSAVADGDITATPVYAAINVNDVAKQIASTVSVATAGIATAYSWAKADYRSAKLVVKVANGTHTELSEILVTLDTNDNVAITEFALVGTNGELATVSAEVSGANVNVVVTTINNSSNVTVVGTLIA